MSLNSELHKHAGAHIWEPVLNCMFHFVLGSGHLTVYGKQAASALAQFGLVQCWVGKEVCWVGKEVCVYFKFSTPPTACTAYFI